MTVENKSTILGELKTQAVVLGGFAALMWLLEIIDSLLPGLQLEKYGIHPRDGEWFWGILFAPFLHGDWGHLISNTPPFLVLGWLIAAQGIGDFLAVTAIVTAIAGLGVWAIGAAQTVHIGASSLIFGYLGFLILRGFIERSLSSVLISSIVGFFYGGLIWGVLPSSPQISWEGHLFGLIGGVLAASLLGRRQANARG